MQATKPASEFLFVDGRFDGVHEFVCSAAGQLRDDAFEEPGDRRKLRHYPLMKAAVTKGAPAAVEQPAVTLYEIDNSSGRTVLWEVRTTQ